MRSKRFSHLLSGVLFSVALVACGGKSRSEETVATQPTIAEPTMTERAPAKDCDLDMDLSGVTVRAVDIEGGVALVFAADGGDPADLRQRVRTMARAQSGAGSAAGQGSATGTGVGNSTVDATTGNDVNGVDRDPSRPMGDDQAKTPALAPPPGAGTTGDVAGGTTAQDTYPVRDTLSGVPAIAVIVDIPGGAQLELRAQDPADVDKLRAHAREQVAEIESGACRTHVSGL